MAVTAPARGARLEEAVVRVMAEVLVSDGLTAADSFYDVGGTSLHAMRICARIRRELGIPIRPEVIFDQDTVGGFCAAVTAARRDAVDARTAASVRDSTDRAAGPPPEPAPQPGGEPLDMRLIHEAVTHQALVRPDAVALVCGTERVSYRRLDALAEEYAVELADLGVRPGHVVPVILPRSRSLVVALLAILKCGAAYAALDHRWPAARIAEVTSTLNAPVVISRTPGTRCWNPAEPSTGRVLRADRRTVAAAVPHTAPAAVFFTSGTTGAPRGVVSPHQATTRLFTPAAFAGFGPGRVMPQAAPPSWDAFSLELWGMLTTGGTSVIVESDYFLPSDLLNLIRTEGVNCLWLTASVFNLFVDENVGCFNGLSLVVTGGERLSTAHAGAFLAAHSGVALVNGYGPVESCVFVTAHGVTARDCDHPDGVPVGKPVPGTTVHILDGTTLLAPGAEGEICVSGTGLADGYLDNEPATAACFATVEIGGRPVRLYRTGDRGRLDDDGVLHFLGRADRQVKIAGHRVQPAEVEAAARKLPTVGDCAAVPVPRTDGGYDRLALFYTPAGRQSGDGPETVRASLRAVLPGHLVPAIVHRRIALPRTLNGKLDQAALLAGLRAPAPGSEREPGLDDTTTEHPMSYEQESIWINDHVQKGTSRYLESWVNRLRGPVDTDAVQRALNGIANRHESLRSRLVHSEGEPVQQVVRNLPVALALRDVTEDGLDAALRSAVSEPIVLSEPPLLKATLLRLSEDDHVLAICVHHTVIDGWSFSLLDHEFSELYRQALGEPRPLLPELPLQFGPYAAAQRENGEAARAEALAYWKQCLRDAPEESAFPTDRPRPDVLGTGGDRIEFAVEAALGQGVRRLSRQLRTTPFAVMTAALAVLIGRHTGQDDMTVGTPISRRDTPELTGLIACLTDVMPLRLRPAADMPFTVFCNAVKESVWSAVRHKDLPYSHLVRGMGVERTLSRFPLFQVVFALDDAPPPNLDLPGVDAERLYIHSGTAKYDMFLRMIPAGEGYRALWEFSTELFDVATAHRFAARLRTLLENVVADPGRPLGELDVLPEEERDQLARWTRDAEAAKAPVLAHDAFRRQAQQQPRAVAVRWRGQHLSYGELDARSEAVAAHLVGQGLERAPVGICVERSLDLPVAVLGVLKAGGAYVPLDPASPADRITFMAEDSGVETVLTQRALADRIALPPGVGRCFLDEVADTERDFPVPVPVTGDALAYVIYTSGSTGRPKGVAMPHGPLANLLDWQTRRSGVGPGDRTLHFASLGFDVAFQELFSTWSSGGTLVIADDEIRRDSERLLDLIDAERVQRLFLPFVALQQLAEHACATGRGCPSLAEVITAGEQVHATPAVRRFFATLCTATLDNQYGPSETHVVTAEMLTGDPHTWPALPPIGRPVDGARIRLLDGLRRPVPAGAVGELCIGGPVLARGYLGRAELTEEKFVRDGEGRLYRSGDLARFLPDGRIQWLGRSDHQVKIRGHRVETGEVEAGLRAVPGVADAVVVRNQGSGAHDRLIAYYLPGAEPPASDTLFSALRRSLPDYMVPSRCIALDAFPRTSSDKVDRKALAARQPQDAVTASASPAAPGTPTEKEIARIWSGLLGTDGIGTEDDFFVLGGDSLLATRLVLALRTELGAAVPLQAVFTAPTIAGLALLLDGAATSVQAQPGLYTEVLAPDIVPAAEVATVAEDPRHVLLTGATGFLGAFMLRDLLHRTRARVHCLVRGHDTAHATERVRAALEQYGLWDRVPQERISVLPGDLAEPRLGLSEADFDRLARTMDAVYHCGASVNLVFSYAQLRDANVRGAEEVLRLAARHRTVPVHHVSTVGVFTSDEPGRIIDAEHPTGPAAALKHGYTQSKWAAEGLIQQARSRGLPVSVYRPTRIFGDTATGACQAGDFMWLILKACVQAQRVPAGLETGFDLAPVNYVSEAVIALSRQAQAASGTFHLAAGRLTRLDTAVAWLRRAGYHLADVDPQEWLDYVEADPGNAAFPLLSAMAAETKGVGSEGGLVFDTTATRRALEGTGIDCPVVDEELFHVYLDYFTRSGFLPTPPGVPAPADGTGAAAERLAE